MTSNIGSQIIMDKLGQTDDKKKELSLEKDMMPLLQQQFRPEFLNRVDDIIIFNPISQKMLYQIVGIQIEEIKNMLKRDKDITLDISAKAFDLIANK